MDEHTLEQLLSFVSLDKSAVRAAGRATGNNAEVAELYKQLDGLQDIWQEEMPIALAAAADAIGGSDILPAIRSGAVHVADITSAGTSAILGEAVRTAVGNASETHTDSLVEAFMALAVETVLDEKSFPLLDAQASGLIRALGNTLELGPADQAARRGNEISAAVAFMAYLPYFPKLPMDEILDLRHALDIPLRRFRGAMASLSADFAHRAIDEEFVVEVEDAWRSKVEPALADIRSALAEQGLLRQAASIALGDPRRMIVEAGGVLAAVEGNLLSLSKIATIGAAVGAPMIDVVGRAIAEVQRSRQDTRKNAFYFLHRVEQVSVKHRR